MRIWVIAFVSLLLLSACGSQTSSVSSQTPFLLGTITNNPDTPKTSLSFLIDGSIASVLPKDLKSVGTLICNIEIQGSLDGHELTTSLELKTLSGESYSIEGTAVSGATLSELNIHEVTCHAVISDGSQIVDQSEATIVQEVVSNTAIPNDELQ